MSWEIETEHVNKAQGLHRFVFIERNVIDDDGQPARFHFHIKLGMGSDGESCGHCAQPVKRDVTLGEDGSLLHVTDGAVCPHALARKKIDELNAFHTRMDKYTAKHHATPFKGPK